MTPDPNYKKRFKIAARTEKWAVTMTKVRIRQAVAHAFFPRWHLLTFAGPDGGESRGVVDLIAIRKDHSTPRNGLKRGDVFQMILIQVKGGSAAKPTAEDAKRLRIVARRHGACKVLLAAWKKGKAARFYSLRKKTGLLTWIEIGDLSMIFGTRAGRPALRPGALLAVGDYESALRRAEGQISEAERRFLREHYRAEDHTATATELALALGYKEYRATNLIYGRLAKKLQRGIEVPRGYGGIGFIVEGERPKAGEHWRLHLRPELAAALDKLAWFQTF
jgi:hypothetical protein